MEEHRMIRGDSVTLMNIEKLLNDERANTELRIFELSDIAKSSLMALAELREAGLGVYEMLSFISDDIDLGSAGDDVDIRPYRELTDSIMHSHSIFDKGVYASLLSHGLLEMGLTERDFFDSGNSVEIFTYVKNSLADEAYDVFSQDFYDPRVKYSRDFSECVRLLLSGEVSYCLLPFEERGGTRLPTIAELIYRHDLKINSVTPVFGMDGTADMKYAMVSLNFTLPHIAKDDDRYLEIRVSADKNITLSDLLSVAVMLGHTVYRVNSHTFSTEEGNQQFFSIVFRGECRDFISLLTFLTLFVDDYITVGVYKNIE